MLVVADLNVCGHVGCVHCLPSVDQEENRGQLSSVLGVCAKNFSFFPLLPLLIMWIIAGVLIHTILRYVCGCVSIEGQQRRQYVSRQE